MRWTAAITLGAGVGLAAFCGAGAAHADSRADSPADPRATADRSAGPARAGLVRQDAVGPARRTAAARRPAQVNAGADRAPAVVRPTVAVTLPPVPLSSGRSFTVSPEAITGAAQDYVAAGGDPTDAPRFFFGDLAVRSLERLAQPAVSPDQIQVDLGNLSVSGYFGGVWLRDNLRPSTSAPGSAGVRPAPSDNPPADLTVSALAIGLFDTLTSGLTQAAGSNRWISTTVAHATVPVLLALYGYNRGYLEFLLENPPAGVPSMQDSLTCTGFLGCSSSAFPLTLDTRYDAALAALDSPTTLGWWEMKAWSALLESATGTGRLVWQAIAGQGGFSPASYAALVDLSSAYLMVSKAAVLSAMTAAADGDADTAAASLRLQAGLWMWSGSYFAGLASAAPAGTLPSIAV